CPYVYLCFKFLRPDQMTESTEERFRHRNDDGFCPLTSMPLHSTPQLPCDRPFFAMRRRDPDAIRVIRPEQGRATDDLPVLFNHQHGIAARGEMRPQRFGFGPGETWPFIWR